MEKRQLLSLQVLRAIAALAVVIHHAIRAVIVNGGDVAFGSPWFIDNHVIMDIGAAGVDVFFILSGFIMVYITAKNCGQPGEIRAFLLNRFVRIWPLYAVITTVACLPSVYALVSSGVVPHDLTLPRLASFAFIPSYNEKGALQPILGVGWTLNYEFYFYFLFSIALLFPRRYLMVTLSTLFISMMFVGQMVGEQSAFTSFTAGSIVLEFLIGVVIGTLYINNSMPSSNPLWWLVGGVTVLLFLATFPVTPDYRFATYGAGAALIFIGTVALDNRVKWPNWLVHIGNASYSIYLVHIIVIYSLALKILRYLQNNHAIELQAEVAALVLIALSVISGLLCYKYVEMPLLRYFGSVKRRGPRGAAADVRTS